MSTCTGGAGHGCHDRPHIRLDPTSYSGQPTITWRIPPDIPCLAYWEGWSVETVQANWPAVTRPHLLVAACYLVRYGNRTWRKRLCAWAKAAHDTLWLQRYDETPDPPRGTGA